jgi:hypothetical protein
MKKIVLICLLGIFYIGVEAQNIQLHYDFGKDRKYLTSTVEMFKPDQWGSTFFFIDMDYSISEDLKGVNMAYWEIARGLKFWDNPFEIHVEYNGGFGLWQAGDLIGYYPINNAWLFGGNYTWASSDFSKVFTLQLMYKYIRDVENASFQVTGVWNLNFFNDKLTLSGFADFWKEGKTWLDTGTKTKFIFLSEPQIWYNATKNFSIGSEVEFGNNFTVEGMKVCPTLAGKWTF